MSLGGRFEGWTLEALIRQLRLDGNEIPDGALEENVLALAEAHFEGRPVPPPPPPPRRKSREASRQRLQYVPSSQAEATVGRLRAQFGLNVDEFGEDEEKEEDFEEVVVHPNQQRRNSRDSQKRNSQRRNSQKRNSQRRNSQRRSGGITLPLVERMTPQQSERIIHSDSLQGASVERARE